jgi:hypothetical protein
VMLFFRASSETMIGGGFGVVGLQIFSEG